VTPEGNGIYAFDFTPRAPGSYVFAVEARSTGLSFSNSQKMRAVVGVDPSSREGAEPK
jgi:hypothetical protein